MASITTIICPLCRDKVEKLVYRYHIDNEKEVIKKIKLQNPSWTKNDGACSRCMDYYHTHVIRQQRVLPEIGPHVSIRSLDDFVILPVGLRLDADQRFTGKGVTICFIDSGFYPHPDLVNHKNRIKEIIDIPGEHKISIFEQLPEKYHTSAWHGTMTSVVCAGDGYLSNGLYKGIASDSEVVLLKVQNEAGTITDENIAKALKWVLANHKTYGIRVVNISVGANAVLAYRLSEIDLAVEKLTEQGIVVVAAVGNDEKEMIKPPANSPNVIAVGGIDDGNNLESPINGLYHSTYGQTSDGLMKPDLLANAIWIAAPILPGTKEQQESEILHQLLLLPDGELKSAVTKISNEIHIEASVYKESPEKIRAALIKRIQTCKYISSHYMHVDGTSFAAPIVSSIIAQVLEVNPQAGPVTIRELLFSTAKRIKSLPALRQGYGIVSPRKAVLKAMQREALLRPTSSPQINSSQKTISFFIHHDCASQISLAGSFNNWAQDILLMEAEKNGLWKIEIPMLPAGRYQYKFFVDDKTWMEDVYNPYREPDGFSGFNSILVIEN